MTAHLTLLLPLLISLHGAFDGHTDVGTVLHPGASTYDPAAKTYTVTGSGDNMWFASDDFHFVWKRVSGDVTLSADIALLGEGGDPHRKAVLMIRQTLDSDSAYADAAVHGDGLTSLQVREEKGAVTHEIESSESAPRRVSIVKQGDLFRILVSGADGQLHVAGGSMRASISGTFYVGIGVCAHNKDAVQTAVFSHVEFGEPVKTAPALYSTLETINVASTDRRVSYVSTGRITAPSWSPDGKTLAFTQEGHRQSIPLAGGTPSPSEEPATESAALSPDGKLLASLTAAGDAILLRVTSIADNKVRVLAKLVGAKGMIDAPSWSPDGRRLAFVSYQLISK